MVYAVICIVNQNVEIMNRVNYAAAKHIYFKNLKTKFKSEILTLIMNAGKSK